MIFFLSLMKALFETWNKFPVLLNWWTKTSRFTSRSFKFKWQNVHFGFSSKYWINKEIIVKAKWYFLLQFEHFFVVDKNLSEKSLIALWKSNLIRCWLAGTNILSRFFFSESYVNQTETAKHRINVNINGFHVEKLRVLNVLQFHLALKLAPKREL